MIFKTFGRCDLRNIQLNVSNDNQLFHFDSGYFLCFFRFWSENFGVEASRNLEEAPLGMVNEPSLNLPSRSSYTTMYLSWSWLAILINESMNPHTNPLTLVPANLIWLPTSPVAIHSLIGEIYFPGRTREPTHFSPPPLKGWP